MAGFEVITEAMRELYPPLHAETLPKQRMKLIVNLDDLGSMGIMFLTCLEAEKRICSALSGRN
jgi:hypothetical protein